jgi:hypothetical protein
MGGQGDGFFPAHRREDGVLCVKIKPAVADQSSDGSGEGVSDARAIAKSCLIVVNRA